MFVGDELLLRKPHPCGTNHWLVRRTGADFRLECAGCGHQIWLTRAQLEARFRRFLARGPRGARLAAADSDAADSAPPADPATADSDPPPVPEDPAD